VRPRIERAFVQAHDLVPLQERDILKKAAAFFAKESA
jgi:hypothetical protein